MPLLRRVVIAAVLLGAGLALSQWVRGLVAYGRSDSWRLGFEMMGIEIALATTAIAIAMLLPGRIGDRLGTGPSRIPTSAVVALAIGTLGLSQAVNGILELTRAHEGSVIVGISRGLQRAESWSLVVAFFGSVVAPAVAEELLCRGLVQRSLARYVRPAVAIGIASIFFGWLHMEMVHGVVATSIGLYLGLAAYWADSTRPAIAGHALNNLAALLASAGILYMSAPIALSNAGGLGVAIGALIWARHVRRRDRSDEAPRGAEADPPQPQPELQQSGGSTDS
jgi:membrane protease YdiL (CAAX protease family)